MVTLGQLNDFLRVCHFLLFPLDHAMLGIKMHKSLHERNASSGRRTYKPYVQKVKPDHFVS